MLTSPGYDVYWAMLVIVTCRKNASVEYEVGEQPGVEHPVGGAGEGVGPAGGPGDAREGKQVNQEEENACKKG